VPAVEFASEAEVPGSFCVVPARPSRRSRQTIARAGNILSQQRQQSNAVDWSKGEEVEAVQTDWRTKAPLFIRLLTLAPYAGATCYSGNPPPLFLPGCTSSTIRDSVETELRCG
jgi:hypothetical protein